MKRFSKILSEIVIGSRGGEPDLAGFHVKHIGKEPRERKVPRETIFPYPKTSVFRNWERK
jgi:hypothetical protein